VQLGENRVLWNVCGGFQSKKAEHDISISGEQEVVIATEIFKILSYA
jgi:hypothetical protein